MSTAELTWRLRAWCRRSTRCVGAETPRFRRLLSADTPFRNIRSYDRWRKVKENSWWGEEIRGRLRENERKSHGLVVAANNCLLCALRFSKYRIEGSCAYVIRTYLCISESGNATQFPGVPNARKMELGVHSPRISPLISLLFATAARLSETCSAINADSDVIIDGNKSSLSRRACQSSRLRYTDSMNNG